MPCIDRPMHAPTFRHVLRTDAPRPPAVAIRLENRQRHKIEEQEADLSRLKSELVSLRRDHDRLLAENGRFSDAVGELQSQLQSVRGRFAVGSRCLCREWGRYHPGRHRARFMGTAGAAYRWRTTRHSFPACRVWWCRE